jgi:hypothetical protein
MPHLDTHSTHSSSAQVLKEDAVVGHQKKEERDVGNMATTKMTQMIKVVIDGNRLCMENRCRNTEDETQTLQHKCKHRR